jgi:DNA excision repair protein ERCC-2
MDERAKRPIRVVDVIAKQAMCPREFASEFSLAFAEFCRLEQKSKACKFWVRDNDRARSLMRRRILHVEEVVESCTALGVCPHRTAVDCMDGADIVICDYNYLFSDRSEGMLERAGVDMADMVLIIDEAHNLPDRIRDHMSGELTLSRLKDAASESRDINARLSKHLSDVADILEKEFGGLAPGDETLWTRVEFNTIVESALEGSLDSAWSYMELALETSQAAKAAAASGRGRRGLALANVSEFLQGWARNYEGCVRVLTGGDPPRLSYRLLDPSHLAKEVFRCVKATVLMSGTLHPPYMYRDLLGMPAEKTVLRTYPSPFPRKNRRVVTVDNVTTLYRRRGPEMYRRMARAIVDVCESSPGNVASFFPSYAIMESVASEVNRLGTSKEVVQEERDMSKGRREECHRRLRTLRNWRGGLLMGVQAGSFSEGMDYADNLLSAVIVVGLPQAPPSLEIRALQNYHSRKFGGNLGTEYGYIFPAMNKVLQAAGRGIRSEKDRGMILLMDERFGQPRYRRYLPEDYDTMVTSNPARECIRFFR